MSTWWGILEIDQDADLRSIKRAYAKKLKTIRQDENPQEFMELRAAYEQARNQSQYQEPFFTYEVPVAVSESAKDNISQNGSPDTEDEANPDLDETEVSPDIIEVNDDQPDHEPIEKIKPYEQKPIVEIPVISGPESLLNEVTLLIKSPWNRSSTQAWQDILEDDRLIPLDDFADFESLLLSFLLEFHGYYEDTPLQPNSGFSPDVGTLIFERFNWLPDRWNHAHLNTMPNEQDLNWLARRMRVRILGKDTPTSTGQQVSSEKKNKQSNDDTNNIYIKGFIKVIFFILRVLFVLWLFSSFF